MRLTRVSTWRPWMNNRGSGTGVVSMSDDNGRSYVDIRIWLDREVEDDGDGGQSVYYSATSLERTGSTLTQVELEGVAELCHPV